MKSLADILDCAPADLLRLNPTEPNEFYSQHRIQSRVDGGVLLVIASNDSGWEHVSVSRARRVPCWAEMQQVCRLFWRPEEAVMQLHPPTTQHIDLCPTCLHLWKPVDSELIVPPACLVF